MKIMEKVFETGIFFHHYYWYELSSTMPKQPIQQDKNHNSAKAAATPFICSVSG